MNILPPALGHQRSRFSGLQTPTELHPWPSCVSTLQMVGCGTSRPPQWHEPIPLINPIYICIYPIRSVSLENSNPLIKSFLLEPAPQLHVLAFKSSRAWSWLVGHLPPSGHPPGPSPQRRVAGSSSLAYGTGWGSHDWFCLSLAWSPL